MQKYYYPPEWYAELKQKSDIGSTISRYINLTKKGKTLWACCPFHHEKTPSFAVNEENQFYHCFGCGESGDAITFVSKMESCSRDKAIELLAERCGMKMPETFGDINAIAKKKQEKDQMLLALKLAKDFYKQNLYTSDAKLAQEYLKKRGFKKSDLDNFEIGYANKSSVIQHLLKNNIDADIIYRAGIAGKYENRLFDPLSDRLVFPILNSYGECVGFSARALKEDKAKYKNTPETPVFDKSSCVYGIHLFRQIKKEQPINRIIIVEGQIDVIKMNSNGFCPCVACLGTAFTNKHSRELKRFSDNIVLMFDGDSAGQKATERAIKVLKENGLNIKVVRLPNGKDPDEVLKLYGKEKMQSLIDNAKDYVEYLLLSKKEKYNLANNHEKTKYIQEALEVISELETASEQEIYINYLSELTKVATTTLKQDLKISKIENEKMENVDVLTLQEDGNIKAIKYILLALITHQKYAYDNLAIEKYILHPTYNSLYKKIINKDDNYDDEEKAIIDSLKMLDEQMLSENFYHECEFKIFESVMKTRQQILSEKYKQCADLDERQKISKEISEIILKLKRKIID